MNMTFDELIAATEQAKKTNTAEEWEIIENYLLKKVFNEIYLELTKACCVRPAMAEPVVCAILGETHPMALESALEDAKLRLMARNAMRFKRRLLLGDNMLDFLGHALDKNLRCRGDGVIDSIRQRQPRFPKLY